MTPVSAIASDMNYLSGSIVVCTVCGEAMKLARVVPKLGPHPELRTFKCEACRAVETRAVAVRQERE